MIMRTVGVQVRIRNDKSYVIALQERKVEKEENGEKETTLFNRSTLLKLLCIVAVLMMTFRGPFAGRYCYIPQSDMVKELLQIQNDILLHVNVPACEHNIIWNGSRLDIPNLSLPIEFDSEGIESGQYYPKHCKPRFSTAIIVPYRNRAQHLEIFLPYMHKLLRKQEIHYRIFVVSQDDDKAWNKGKLFNTAAKIVNNLGFSCMILHDVDLLPLHESNLFACTRSPRHMSANIDKFRYTLMYDTLVGGALAITTDQYETINGYSNKFEMWGGEDDELSDRIRSENFTIQRFSPEISIYSMMVHSQEPINVDRFRTREENRGRYKEDGLNNLKVDKISLLYHPLYTNISVKL